MKKDKRDIAISFMFSFGSAVFGLIGATAATNPITSPFVGPTLSAAGALWGLGKLRRARNWKSLVKEDYAPAGIVYTMES